MKKRYVSLLAIVVVAIIVVSIFAGCESSQGMSAYDIAVANGFEGTEQEWLDNLKGQDGIDGTNGSDGQNGQDGQDVSIEDIYKTAVAKGYQGTFLEFLKEYLSMDIDEDLAGVNTALLSAVSIVCEFELTQQSFVPGYGIQESTYTATSAGSGVIYSLDKQNGNAYIITNHHVVYYSLSNNENGIGTNIKVMLYGQEYSDYAISATYIGGSATYDIAVLKIENSEVLKNSQAKAVTLADYGDVKVGSSVMAIGNASGEGISVTQGIISVDSETITITNEDDTESTYRVMRVDAAINSGNSGGGLFDKNGQLIGIVNAKVNSTSIENIGYAIPISIAIGVADNIIDNCDGAENTQISKYTLGVSITIKSSSAVYDENTMTTYIQEVLEIAQVSETGAVYGILEAGDIIKSISIGGNAIIVDRRFKLEDALFTVRPGDKIDFEVVRNGETITVSIEAADSAHFVELA